MNYKSLVGSHIEYRYRKGSILSTASSVLQNQRSISKSILRSRHLPEYSKIALYGEMYNYYKNQPCWLFVKYLFSLGRYLIRVEDYLGLPYSDRLKRILKILEKDPKSDPFRKEHIDIFRYMTYRSKRYVSENKHLLNREEYIYINTL